MSTPAQAQDVFDATRDVVNRLTPFAEEERSRIVRWAMEMLGISGYGSFKASQSADFAEKGENVNSAAAAHRDIRAFVQSKRPRSDVQFTAVVAYFYQFISPSPLQDIGIEELKEAHRQARRKRPKSEYFSLNNAVRAGYINRAGRGRYRLNSVGENLVAITLPDAPETAEPNNQK